MGSSPTRGSSFSLGKVTALGVLCCFALFVCLILLASFFLPSHLSLKYVHCASLYDNDCHCSVQQHDSGHLERHAWLRQSAGHSAEDYSSETFPDTITTVSCYLIVHRYSLFVLLCVCPPPLSLCQDPSYQFKDIKQLIMGMLETYNYEEVPYCVTHLLYTLLPLHPSPFSPPLFINTYLLPPPPPPPMYRLCLRPPTTFWCTMSAARWSTFAPSFSEGFPPTPDIVSYVVGLQTVWLMAQRMMSLFLGAYIRSVITCGYF